MKRSEPDAPESDSEAPEMNDHPMDEMYSLKLIRGMKTDEVRAAAVADDIYRAVEMDIQDVKNSLQDEHEQHLNSFFEAARVNRSLDTANATIASKDHAIRSKDQIITTLSHKLELAKVQLKNYEKMHDSLRFILKHSD
jgi:hypothetical protein